MSDFAAPKVDPRTLKVSYGDEDAFRVEFYWRPIHMEAISENSGRPVYEDRIFCKKIRAGDTKTVWDTLATGVNYGFDGDGNLIYECVELDGGAQADWERFPQAWARFEKKGEKAKTGVPIEEMPGISRSFSETLKAMHIHTVEQLAALSDTQAGSFMGGMGWREKAKSYLDKSYASAALAKADADRREQDERIAQMEKTIKDLQAALEKKRHKDAA